jgi:hypothetical protein
MVQKNLFPYHRPIGLKAVSLPAEKPGMEVSAKIVKFSLQVLKRS